MKMTYIIFTLNVALGQYMLRLKTRVVYMKQINQKISYHSK